MNAHETAVGRMISRFAEHGFEMPRVAAEKALDAKVSEMAEHLGVSRDHITRKYFDEAGVTEYADVLARQLADLEARGAGPRDGDRHAVRRLPRQST